VSIDGHAVLQRHARSLRSVRVPGLPGAARHTIRVYEFAGKRLARKIVKRVYGCAHR
jgi:hypothetical protein